MGVVTLEFYALKIQSSIYLRVPRLRLINWKFITEDRRRFEVIRFVHLFCFRLTLTM